MTVRKKGSIASAVQDYVVANPSVDGVKVAAIFGCDPALVSRVRKQCGLARADKYRVKIKVNPPCENSVFIKAECLRLNIDRKQLMHAIVTDARLAKADTRDERIRDAIMAVEAALDMPESEKKRAALAQVKETWEEFKV